MSTKTYGGYTVEQLQEIVRANRGQRMGRFSVEAIRDLLAALASRPAADESAKPVYQVTEDDAAWHDTDWMTYDSAPTKRRRIVYTHPASTASKEAELIERQANEIEELRAQMNADIATIRIKAKEIEALTAELASKESVTLSDEARDAERYRRMREIYRESGRIDAARESDAAYDARIDESIAQRDASKAEGQS